MQKKRATAVFLAGLLTVGAASAQNRSGFPLCNTLEGALLFKNALDSNNTNTLTVTTLFYCPMVIAADDDRFEITNVYAFESVRHVLVVSSEMPQPGAPYSLWTTVDPVEVPEKLLWD